MNHNRLCLSSMELDKILDNVSYKGLKWQSLSLNYRVLLLILLNHYMFNEVMRYLHDNKWLGSQ